MTQEEVPFSLAGRFKNKRAAGAVYDAVQELIYNDVTCDLSAFRIRLKGIWHVILIGEKPSESLYLAIEAQLSNGTLVTIDADVLIYLMDPVLREFAVPDLEEINACPLDRSAIAFDTDRDQRRHVVIACQDVMHLRTEGALRQRHDLAHEPEHLVLPPVLAREGIPARIMKQDLVAVEAHRRRDVATRQGVEMGRQQVRIRVSHRLARRLRDPSAAALMNEADAKARLELGRPVHEEFDVVASGEVAHPIRCGNPLSVLIRDGQLVEEALEARGPDELNQARRLVGRVPERVGHRPGFVYIGARSGFKDLVTNSDPEATFQHN